MKHFIIEIIFSKPMEAIEKIVPDHRAFLQTGYDKDLLLCSGPLNPRTGGMVVARAESMEAIQEFFKADPYKLNDVADYRFSEFNPVKFHPILKDWV